MCKPYKTAEDFIVLFCRRLTSLPAFVESAWVWAFSYELQDSESACPLVQYSGIDRGIEGYMVLIRTLGDYKMDEVLFKELKAYFEGNNTPKLSFLLVVFSEVLKEPFLTKPYCRDISAGLCRVIKVDNTSPEGRMLIKVKESLSNLLQKKFKTISRVLKVMSSLASSKMILLHWLKIS